MPKYNTRHKQSSPHNPKSLSRSRSPTHLLPWGGRERDTAGDELSYGNPVHGPKHFDLPVDEELKEIKQAELAARALLHSPVPHRGLGGLRVPSAHTLWEKTPSPSQVASRVSTATQERSEKSPFHRRKAGGTRGRAKSAQVRSGTGTRSSSSLNSAGSSRRRNEREMETLDDWKWLGERHVQTESEKLGWDLNSGALPSGRDLFSMTPDPPEFSDPTALVIHSSLAFPEHRLNVLCNKKAGRTKFSIDEMTHHTDSHQTKKRVHVTPGSRSVPKVVSPFTRMGDGRYVLKPLRAGGKNKVYAHWD